MELVSPELPATKLVVAVDSGKVFNRVALATGEQGLIGGPVSLPVGRKGIEQLCRLITAAGGGDQPLIAIEATGSLHEPWARELEALFPGSLRLFAPSETQAARTQLGSRRLKTDDRDCAALISLARQGRGRYARTGTLDALLDAVRHRRRLISQRKVGRQQIHHQLNALCPGLSAPPGHGRALELAAASGRAVLACAVEFAGRAPKPRSLLARARPAEQGQRGLLGGSLGWLPAAAPRRRAARRAPRTRCRALALVATRRRCRRGPDRRAAGQ